MSGYVEYLVYHSASTANVLPITSVCNVACVFCSHRGNPPSVRTYKLPPLAVEKVRDIVGYLDPKRKIVIGESVTRIDEGEPLTHPEFFAIIEVLRETCPDATIQITTNGSLLDEETVNRLASYRPVEINLSLNSASSCGRECLMQDRRAEIAVASPLLLAKYRIPFHGSIVAMPHLVGWQDIEATCRHFDKHDAQSIRLFLPGFTRYSPLADFYPPEMAAKFHREVAALSAELKTPLMLEPFVPKDTAAVLEGVMPGSAAARAGLRRGDVIAGIDSSKPRSRVEAFRLLMQQTEALLTVQRGGETLALRYERQPEERPGVVMYHDIDMALVDELTGLGCKQQATSLAIFTSSLAFSLWRKVFADTPGIYIYKVPSLFFGGTIGAAGLLTVSDYQEAITAAQSQRRHDLIVIPRVSFDVTGKDLTGRSYLELETGGSEIFLS